MKNFGFFYSSHGGGEGGSEARVTFVTLFFFFFEDFPYLEPGVWGGRQEEAREAPEGVGQGSSPGEVRQRDEHPLCQHVLLVLELVMCHVDG